MKLSEAILLGSVGTEQGRGRFLDEKGRTCAMGAAYTAIGLQIQSVFSTGQTCHRVFLENAKSVLKARELWPILNTMVQHPVVAEYHHRLEDTIQALNDSYGWTRPQIAEWVATIEQQQEAKELNGGLIEEEVQLR